MADVFTKEKRSEIMSRVKCKDTKPEKLVRSMLHRMGYRFRLHVKDLPGKPDIVLPRFRKIILVHGCFWHGHGRCRKGQRPESNKQFWNKKIEKNKHRDRLTRSRLKRLGWKVLIIWECETKDIKGITGKLQQFMDK